jgi:uncharacterized protein
MPYDQARSVIGAATVGLVLTLSIGCAGPSTQPSTQPTTARVIDAPTETAAGMAVYVGDELLKDYAPKSTLVTPLTRVDRSKFAAIDFHCHWSLEQDADFLVRKMDELNLTHAVNLSGGYGDALFAQLEKFATPSNGRLIIFANLDFKQIDDADWGQTAAAQLEEAHRRGAKGLKIFKSLGLTVRDRNGIVPVDDPRLRAVWDTCGRLGMPVLIHSADPVAFFAPTDQHNERWMQLKRHPSWSFYGEDFPDWQTVVEQRNRVIAAHPNTTFVVAHMAEAANDYGLLAAWLDRYPNLFVDISGRENEIGRQPRASRAFFEKYADRILFGTDRYPGRFDQPRYKVYFRMLESQDEYFDYFEHGFPPAGEWKIYGLGLTDDTLRKIYADNARRILKLP